MIVSSAVASLTEANFADAIASQPGMTVADFWAPWCGPCRVLAPVVEEMARDYAGRARFVKVDVDANPALASEFGVRSIPTLLFFRDGQVVDRIVGAAPKPLLVQRLEALAVASPR